MVTAAVLIQELPIELVQKFDELSIFFCVLFHTGKHLALNSASKESDVGEEKQTGTMIVYSNTTALALLEMVLRF